MMKIKGKVVPGKGIASGKNIDEATGLTNTISLQRPFFTKAGVPLDDIFNGTVNVDITPKKIRIEKPDFEIECLNWSPGVTETFQLVEVEILYKNKSYQGFIYYPLPSPVKSHPDNFVELLAPTIEGLEKGRTIEVVVKEGKVSLN